jgi:hypothetical protein
MIGSEKLHSQGNMHIEDANVVQHLQSTDTELGKEIAADKVTHEFCCL